MKSALPHPAKTPFVLAALLAAAGMTAVLAAPAPSRMLAYMTGTVMTATDPIWKFSYADNMTEADWDAVKKAAADLNASAAIVAAGGPAPADRRASSAMWREWAGKFSATAAAANRAAQAKNQMALAMAGDMLVEICEGCHTAFPAPAQ